jgi:hypothetical protein
MELLRFGILELLSESIFFTITFKVSPKRRRYGCGPLYSFQKFYIFAGSNSYNTASTEASTEVSRTTQSMQVRPVLRVGKFSCSGEPWLLLGTTQLHPCLSGPPLPLSLEQTKQSHTHLYPNLQGSLDISLTLTTVSRSIQRGNRRNHISWREEMPTRQGAFGAGTYRDRKDLIFGQVGLKQSSEHI